MSGKSKFLAVLSYFWFLVIIPLLFCKGDSFVCNHAKQGTVLLLMWVVLPYVAMIPLIGWVVAIILLVINVIMMIFGIVNALMGREKYLPYVGRKIEPLMF